MLLLGDALNPCAKTCGSFLFLIGFFISRNETRYRDVLDNVHVLVHGFDVYVCKDQEEEEVLLFASYYCCCSYRIKLMTSHCSLVFN